MKARLLKSLLLTTLTLTLATGFAFSETLFGRAMRFDHKTVFGLLSWLTFGGLLYGRLRHGWRGRTALRWTLTGFVLLILEMLWGRAALVIFAVSFDGMPDFAGSIHKLLSADTLGFVTAYLTVGAVFAGLIFGISVIAMPLLLDRETDAVTAGLASLKLCLTQPLVMAFWGFTVTVLVLLAMLPYFAGLLVIGPWLGHASWHLYREALSEVPAQ